VHPERPVTTGASYLPELDGLRAVAILLVMAYHLWDYRGVSAIGQAMNRVAREGWIGVDVFFALSGFLITRILLRSRASPSYYASFYIRRSLRIFPLYYAVLALLTVGGLVASALGIRIGELPPEQLGRIWLNYLYLSNFALAFLGSNAIPIDISWSLAVEEQFYLVYPFIVRKLGRPALERWLLVAVLVAVPLRLLSFEYFPGNHYGPYALPYCRMDSLAVGCVAALWLERPESSATRLLAAAALPLWAAALLIVFAWHRGELPLVILGYAMTATATAATIVRLQLGGFVALRRLLQWSPLVALGKVSYGLYLLHLFVRAGVNKLPWWAPQRDDLALEALRVLVTVVASVVVAAASWWLFESPILRLKARLEPRQKPSAA
jgi:peptidoglycan/LPS O-acetylase OafA/YrhL